MNYKKAFYTLLIPLYLTMFGCGDNYKRTYYVGEFHFVPPKKNTDCREICDNFRNLIRRVEVNEMMMDSCDDKEINGKKFKDIINEKSKMLEKE